VDVKGEFMEKQTQEAIRQPIEAETFLVVQWICPVCQRKCRRKLQWVPGDLGGILAGMPHNRPGTKETCPESVMIAIQIPAFEVNVYDAH